MSDREMRRLMEAVGWNAAGVSDATDPLDGPEAAQETPGPVLMYKGRPATPLTLANLRMALSLPEDHPVSQEALDAFAQLTSINDPMREAMLGLKDLGSYPKTVAAVFCAMGAEVREAIFGYGTTADCFCRVDRDESTAGWWAYDPKVVRFIYDAVKEKIKREALPETLEHVQTVGGKQLRVTMRRVGARDYEVADAILTDVEAF